MSVLGYGDNYGDRYAQVYTSETLAIAASATPAGVVVQGYGDNYGRAYGEDFVTDGIDIAIALESGSATTTATPTVVDVAQAIETLQVDGNTEFSLSDIATAEESVSVASTTDLQLTSVGRVDEDGEIIASAQYRFTPLVLTDSDDPVDAIKTILGTIGVQGYAQSPPDVFAMWELDPQQRLSKSDPAVYVWSPTPGSFDRFSADGMLTTDSRTVEIMVMTYSEMSTHRYTESIIDILGGYMDDNRELTIYEDVDVDTVADERGDHIFGESNHYINTIEISTSRLRRTDVI